MISAIRRSSPDTASQRRIDRHVRQICRRAETEHLALCETFSITFRPGDNTANFLKKALRPSGTSVLVVLSYRPSVSHSVQSLRMPVRGFRGSVSRDGFLQYGGEAGCSFLYDAWRRPFRGAYGSIIDPCRNPSLVDLVYLMDKACSRRIARSRWLGRVPTLPKIMLAFPPNEPPVYEDSPRLRAAAAQRVGIPASQLGGNGNSLLHRLLRDIWEENLVLPGAPGNATGCVLISADLCMQANRALMAYEDFSALLGLYTWNPAREVEPVQLPNPASGVFENFGISATAAQDVSADTVEAMERAMRCQLGSVGERLSQAEIYDALVHPAMPISAWSLKVEELRSNLSPFISECTTDEDLLRAAQTPQEPLLASGACQIQVLGLRRTPAVEAFYFGPDELGRRACAQLWVSGWGRQSISV